MGSQTGLKPISNHVETLIRTLKLTNFPYENYKNLYGRAQEGLVGLKLDEIDAANSFPMLPMARNGLKRPFKTHQKSIKNLRKTRKNTKIIIFCRIFVGLAIEAASV